MGGTFFLVLTAALGGGAWSIAASLMCMIFALGSVSGANFNPAVSLSILATRRPEVLSGKDCSVYIISQLLGGIAGGLVAGAVGLVSDGDVSYTSQIGFAEFAYTFVLCLVVLAVATVQNNQLSEFFGFAIGSCVTAGGTAVGNVSGGFLNPAVAFGLAVACVHKAD